jgi:hypothetical protein
MSLCPFSDKINLDIIVLYKKVDFYCPIALQNNFVLKNSDDLYSEVLIVVLPDKNKEYTHIMILCHKDFKTYFSNKLNSKIKVLNFIESEMMKDSEFFINPLIINEEKIRTIEEDFYFHCFENSSLGDYDISIFDDIRKKLCLELPEEERVRELKKIYETPVRESIKDRNRNALYKSIKDRYKKIDATTR